MQADAAAARLARTERLRSGPMLPTLLALAAPNLAVMALQTAAGVLEAWYVGHFGTPALAAFALVFPTLMLQQMLSAGAMGGGVSSAVARALGAGDAARAEALAAHAFWLAVLLGAGFTVPMLFAAVPIFAALGGRGDALALAADYGTVAFLGSVAVWVCNILASVARGSGDMRTPARVLATAGLLQAVLGGLLCFGIGGWPGFGLPGVPAAMALSFAFGAGWLLLRFLSGRGGLALRPFAVRFDPALAWDILRVGALASLSPFLTVGTVLALTALAGGFGEDVLAGYGLGARLELMLVPLVFGVGAALTALVGTNAGAGDWPRARQAAWTGAALAAAIVGPVGLLFGALPGLWLGLFTADPDVMASGAAYLSRVGPCYALFAIGLSLYFASQGAGRMLWPTVAGFARLAVAAGGGWLVAIAWRGGPDALFAAIAVGMAVFCLLVALPIRFGAWPR